MREKFLKVSSEGFQSVNEIMVPFKGKSSSLQFMPAKPVDGDWNELSHSEVSGFLCDFSVYKVKAQRQGKSECGVIKDIALILTKTLNT